MTNKLSEHFYPYIINHNYEIQTYYIRNKDNKLVSAIFDGIKWNEKELDVQDGTLLSYKLNSDNEIIFKYTRMSDNKKMFRVFIDNKWGLEIEYQ